MRIRNYYQAISLLLPSRINKGLNLIFSLFREKEKDKCNVEETF